MKLALAIASLTFAASLQAQDIFTHEHTNQSYASVAINDRQQVLVPVMALGDPGSVPVVRSPSGPSIDSLTAMSPGGAVSGMVLDSATGKPVGGVEVSIQEARVGTWTNGKGRFTIPNLPAGPATLVFRLLGYRGIARPITIQRDQVIDGTISLVSVNTQLTRIVVTGTIAGTEEKAIPNAITVITAQDIEKRGVTTIDQLFRGAVPGVVVLNTGPSTDDNKVRMFSRGGTSVEPGDLEKGAKPLKTYIDGVEVTDPSYINRIDVNSIDHIEILTGPQGSTLYGSNSINGVIQVFTKRGAPKSAMYTSTIKGGFIQSSYSKDLTGQYDVTAGIAGTSQALSYNGSLTSRYQGAWIPKRDQTYYSGTGGIAYQQQKFSLDGSAILSQSAMNGGTGGDYVGLSRQLAGGTVDGYYKYDPASALITNFNSKVQQQHVSSSAKYAPWWWFSNQVTLGYDNLYTSNLQKSPNFQTPDDSLNRADNTSQGTTSIAYSAIVRTPEDSWVHSILTVGFDGSDYSLLEHMFSGVNISGRGFAEYASNMAFITASRSRGGFAQELLAFRDALFFTVGIRGEYNSLYGGQYGISYTPRYGVSFVTSLGDVSAKFRASYGNGTRPPTKDQLGPSYDLFSDGTPYVIIAPADHLGPESQRGYDAGVELYLGSRASLVVTHYNQQVRSAIEQLVVDTVFRTGAGAKLTYQYFNIGDIRNDGWETTASWNMGPVSLQGVYSWTRSRIEKIAPDLPIYRFGTTYLQVGEAPQYLPEHTWSADIGYGIANSNIHLFVTGIGQSNLNTFSSYPVRISTVIGTQAGSFNSASRSGVAPAYAMANLRATQQINRVAQFVLEINNLSNMYVNDLTGAAVAHSYAATGRTALFGLNFRW